MFNYQDPVGRNFLQNTQVKEVYQRSMESIYDSFARRPDSAFTWVEAFDHLSGGQQSSVVPVDWPAFPLTLTAVATDDEIDADRFQFQDEYVEWRVERKRGKIARITFMTEFPEYYQAFAEVGAGALIEAVREAIPGANPTIRELFGAGPNPDQQPLIARANRFRNNLTSNPWNSGRKGILCLTQQFNTMNALFNLVAECGVLDGGGEPEDTCGNVGGACGSGRNSDPRICTEAQRAVRNRSAISLKDPVGIFIRRLLGTWKINGAEVDINDTSSNQGAWLVSRNGRRAVLDVSKGVTIGDDEIVSGTQVSKQLIVSAEVIAASEDAIPDWAKTGGEAQSRGPNS
jgi:hypothetical protein